MRTIRHRKAAGAFSLIEVTIALGIIAFAMVSIMGLLSVSFSTAHDAANDTALTAIVRNVTGDLRGLRPDSQGKWPVPGADGTGLTRYFFRDGSPCEEAGDSAALENGAIYKVTVDGQADSGLESADGTVNLVKLHLQIQGNAHWPAQDPNRKDFYADIARH